jgi:hypothetical protein
MDIHTARVIAELRTIGYSWRAIAEVYYPPENDFHGDQGDGQELCREAAIVLRAGNEDSDDFFEGWSRNG